MGTLTKEQRAEILRLAGLLATARVRRYVERRRAGELMSPKNAQQRVDRAAKRLNIYLEQI